MSLLKCYCNNQLWFSANVCSREAFLRSPLRDIVVGKIRGEWKKIQGGRKKYFSNVLRSLAKLLRSLEKLCVLSQNFCVLSQRYLRSLAKLKKKKIFTRERKSFARERKYLCERTQKFCEGTQSFSRERKSFARERKTFEKYFFLPPWIFSTHSDFFPPQCPLKGSVLFRAKLQRWQEIFQHLQLKDAPPPQCDQGSLTSVSLCWRLGLQPLQPLDPVWQT